MSTLETGCYLDNHRGHYITRDMINLAREYGFIVSECERWVLDTYHEHSHQPDYPHEALYELADEAQAWLNNGRGTTRMPGQNLPPAIPDGAYWDWNEGDFGLYDIEELDES